VVREAEQVRLQDVTVPAPAPSVYAQSPGGQYPYATPSSGGLQYSSVSTRYDPLPGISLRDVTPDDYRLVREMLERIRRGELQSERGEELAQRLAQGVAARMGFDFRDWQQRGWHALTFLQSVLEAREARGE
jgi:hypothetical protein